MFNAYVIACALFDPTHCIKFENAIHPLKSERACEARAMEMANDINEMLTDFKAVRWQCYALAGGKLT